MYALLQLFLNSDQKIDKTLCVLVARRDSNFNVNITEIGYNDVTLTWDEFPSRVQNLVFRIRLQGDLAVSIDFYCSFTF